MPKTLQETITPASTKGFIKQAMRSNWGKCKKWCIVEGSDDVGIYIKFIDANTTKILQARGESDGNGGYKNVVTIVTELLAEESNCLIFGICDRDYTGLVTKFASPSSIFLTDNRDIEIMMLNAPSVIGGLRLWNNMFPEKLRESIEASRYLGYLRIFNFVFETRCTFHNKIKFSRVWDMNTHSLKEDWKDRLLSKFVENCEVEVTDEQITQFVSVRKLESKLWVDVCRGHDILDLLHLMMVKKEYSEEEIFTRIVNDYSYNNFKSTSLYNDISRWAKSKNVTVLLE